MKKKIIRVTTVPISLGGLLQGQLKFMSSFYEILGVSSVGVDNKLKKVGQQEKVRVLPIEMTRKITPFQDIKALIKLYKLFKKEKPLIVHSHTPKAGTLSMIAAKFAGVPHRLHTIAGLPLLEANGLKRTILNTVEKITYSCATKIYPNSFGLKEIILKNKFTTKKKIKVIANGSSNGIDTEVFDNSLYSQIEKDNLRKTLNISKDDLVYIFIGRIVTDKGINELIEAFSKINKTSNNVKLLLVGGYESELDPLSSKTLNIIETNKNIISTGWVNDVRSYLSISNVLTFPSYREGFPNVVMQAGAMGLPCIVSNINGCNEIIIEGENGTIIPVKDSDALYNSMLKFYNNKQHFDSKKCRDLIVKRYKRQVVWDALLNEYQQIDNS
ncbi:glycosyltransferase family 4 protein [Seonamhaeicola marinus]|uniref:Glycosyltransferase family 4 protein n=1 Tax=Seonamhaeicola marinus TaxID=1912246 RepID=A0A5D0HR64_9FLAO|nr:glycosyltransferase family 4 protein [Seonamhaeicola marinus]TYA71862.1 glycosyltransferase family 4 protein [Seonamhaeicola marinus]